MHEPKKWKYFAVYCSFKETTTPGQFGGNREGLWVLHLEKEYSLSDGLNHMGMLGYELVGIQLSQLRNGDDVGERGWYCPASFYIFKRPLDE